MQRKSSVPAVSICLTEGRSMGKYLELLRSGR
jgi:hypothetical protein